MYIVAGTVKLSIYYHEPSKPGLSLISSGDGKQSPANKQQIKGMIFDRSSRCYYPADSGKQRSAGGGLADLVLNFKLKRDEEHTTPEPQTTRLRLLNAARKRLLRNRKEG